MNERKDRIRIHIDNKEYSVVGGKFQEMLAAVKQIDGRRFVSELKVWQLPGLAEDVRHQLEIGGYQLEGGTPLDQKPQQPTQSPPARTGGDRIRVLIQGHQIAVVGGTFQAMLAEIKNVPGRRFDGERKIWEIPGDLNIIKQLIEAAGFQLEGVDNIPTASTSAMAPPDFGPTNAPPPAYEEPDFLGNDDVPPYEPPDWWDDDNAPIPNLEPPAWLEDEMNTLPPDDPPLFDNQPPPSISKAVSSASKTPRTSQGGDQIRIRVGGIPMLVSGGAFQELLTVIKQIPGRRFDGNDKVWDIPAEVGLESVQQTVNAAGFDLKRG